MRKPETWILVGTLGAWASHISTGPVSATARGTPVWPDLSDAKQLRKTEDYLERLTVAGFHTEQLLAAGFEATQFRAAQFDLDQLQSFGFEATQLRAAEVDLGQLKAGGADASAPLCS